MGAAGGLGAPEGEQLGAVAGVAHHPNHVPPVHLGQLQNEAPDGGTLQRPPPPRSTIDGRVETLRMHPSHSQRQAGWQGKPVEEPPGLD